MYLVGFIKTIKVYLTMYVTSILTSIKIKNASLCLGEGHNFVLVTVGTDITTSIDDLRLKWFRHTHDGTFGEERINIKNLAGVFVKEHVRLFLPDVTFSKSSVEDNHLPMYLHRIGYTTDTSVNNGNNSMLGTLLMSRLEFDYQDADNQPIQSKDGVSQTLSFGGIGNDGAHIKRDSNSNLYIEGQENPKTGSTIAPNVQINSYNNIDSIAVDSIVNTAPNIFEKANYIYDDYEQNKKIRYENGSQELFTNQEYYYQNRESIDNTLDSNTINDAEHSLDYSSTFETTDLFNTKTDLTIWKDHSDIQIRKDIENTYTLQPRMLSNIPDYYRPNLNKINESSGSFEWLVYAGEVYKNGDESTKIGCPAIGYKNLNIKEYILPIEDDNFVLEYKDEIQLNSDENFDLPWLDNSGNEIQNNVNHEHVISFGEFQQLARNPDNSSQFELTTQTILREGTVGSTQNVGGYNFLDNDLRIFKYKSNKTRTFNYLDITNLINNNLKTTSYDEEEINRILSERGPIIRDNAVKMAEFEEQMADVKSIAKSVGNEFNAVGDKVLDAFLRGKSGALDFKAILRELIISIQKTIIQTLILDQVNKFVKNAITGIFAPKVPGGGTNVGAHGGSAGGGTVQQGRPELVGERGPELFVPNSAGSIKTNADTKSAMGGGGGVSITQNLNFAVGITNTVRAEVMNMLPAIQQSTVQAVADAKQRGGKFSKAFGS